MPDFDVTGPDKKIYTITGPEGSTREQALERAPVLFAQGKLRLKEQEEQRGIGERLATGFMDPFYGMAQVGARMSDPGSEIMPMPAAERDARIANIDKIVKEREAGIQQRAGTGVDWWRLVGEAGNPALYIPALTGGLAGAAASGFTAALARPTTETDDFVNQKLQEGMWGAAFGLGGGAVTNIAGKAVSPIIGRVAQNLMNKGVELTPGRIAGEMMSRMEDAARSIPWLGHFVRQASRRTLADYNLAAINQSLEPIGKTLRPGIRAGREAIEETQRILDDAYDNVLNRPGVYMSPLSTIEQQSGFPYLQDMIDIRNAAKTLPPDAEKSFLAILGDTLENRLNKAGILDGPALKDVESELGFQQREYMKSSLKYERDMGRLFQASKEAIRDALERQNPAAATELQDINHAYAMFRRVEGASTRRAGAGAEEGVFTPMDLAAAVRQQDPTRNKRSYARGDALMQEFAEWGQFLLPQKIPDSGTPERSMWALLGLGAGSMGLVPAVKTAAKAAAVTVPYLAPSQRIINRWARTANRPWRRNVRAGAEAAAPFVGAVGATPLMQEAVPAGATAVFDAAGNLVMPANAMEAPQNGGSFPQMTEQEQYMFQHHRNNLQKGGVKNPDGSVSTYRSIGVDMDGRYYMLPTIWNNRRVSDDEAIRRAQEVGLDKFPSYSSQDVGESRYQFLHDYMERDMQ